MLDFGPFCYLDNHKTGSSFVVRFLKQQANIAPVKHKLHNPFRFQSDRDVDKFFFITVREPLDTYRSLYKYGMTGRGMAGGNRRERPQLVGLYDGSEASFHTWLEKMLDPEFADTLPNKYDKGAPSLFGLMTFRFLRLSLKKPFKNMKDWTTSDQVRSGFASNRLPVKVLRNEELNQGLAKLVENELRPYMKDVGAALQELSNAEKRVNATNSENVLDVSDALKQKVREREWFLYEQFYE